MLEIIIAVTIFGIISLAIYGTFRVGLRSYESGRDLMVVAQTARETFDLLARDLRALYYQPPAAYNQSVIHQRQLRRMMKLQKQTIARQEGKASTQPDEEEEERLGGLLMDLTIIGSDKGECDSLTFVTYQMNWGTAPMEPWGLARVKYWVEEGNMFRAEGPVTVENIPTCQTELVAQLRLPAPFGQDLTQPEAEEPAQAQGSDDYLKDIPRELIARNVKTFDVSYGYWTDEGWKEAPDWVAHERRYRNPPLEVAPDDPNFAMIAQWNSNRPQDGIPAYVTATLALGYGKDSSKTRLFRTRIRLMNSTETYEPFLPLFVFPSTPYGVPGVRPPFRR